MTGPGGPMKTRVTRRRHVDSLSLSLCCTPSFSLSYKEMKVGFHVKERRQSDPERPIK